MAETERTNTDLDALKEALDKEFNTTGMTLPNVPPFQSVEDEKYGAAFREALLNPDKGDTVIDSSGTTMNEYRQMMNFGIPPKDSPVQDNAKHVIETKVVNGETVIEITAPSLPKDEVTVVPSNTVNTTAPVSVTGKNDGSTKDANTFTRVNSPVVPTPDVKSDS